MIARTKLFMAMMLLSCFYMNAGGAFSCISSSSISVVPTLNSTGMVVFDEKDGETAKQFFSVYDRFNGDPVFRVDRDEIQNFEQQALYYAAQELQSDISKSSHLPYKENKSLVHISKRWDDSDLEGVAVLRVQALGVLISKADKRSCGKTTLTHEHLVHFTPDALKQLKANGLLTTNR